MLVSADLSFRSNASIGSELSPFDELAIKKVLEHFHRRDLSILEVGSWVGEGSTKIFAEFSNTLICVDSWKGNNIPEHENVIKLIDPYTLFRENTKDLPTRIVSMRGLSEDVLPYLPRNAFDVIFIDADHTYEGIRKDVSLALSLLKKNGILLGHDCEVRVSKLDNLLTSLVESERSVDALLCSDIVDKYNLNLPILSEVSPELYPDITPLIKFKHIHPGVIKAVSELNIPRLYFSDKLLERDRDDRGFSSIWAAKRPSFFMKNTIFEEVESYIRA